MFNIEEKIKKWYENQKNVPIVKNDSKENEEVVYTTSNKSSSTIKDINELKNAINKNQKEYDKLKAQVVYDFENDPNNDYSDESLEKKAEKIAREEYENSYAKEELKNKNKISDLDYKRSEILSDSTTKQSKINDNYDNILNETTDKAIKNGISRSSILDGETEKYLGEKEDEILKVLSNTDNAMKNNDKQKEAETLRYENALEKLDSKKDEIKNKELEALKMERQKLIDNGVLTGEFKFNENYKSPEMIDVRKNIISDVLNFYGAMNNKTAISKYEEDKELQDMLGDLEPVIRTYLTGKGHYYQ